MSTVARRDFLSIPHRDAHATWVAIVSLLTAGASGAAARADLMAVAGIASSIIADQAPADAPILVTCDGPQTRVYCHYDDDALDDSNANEAPLGFDALKGNWQVSLPVAAEELAWVTSALKAKTTRVVARDPSKGAAADQGRQSQSMGFVVDAEGFLKP